MIKQTIYTTDFRKKTYAAPKMETHQVKAESIICTSPTSTQQNEEYTTGSTSNWF